MTVLIAFSLAGRKNWPATLRRPRDNQEVPSNRVDSSDRLRLLRLKLTNIDAYIVPSNDAHMTSGMSVSPRDQRLKYISGFSGSTGVAVVTKTANVLITDGRYEEQADEELACNWQLVVQSRAMDAVITWIKKHLKRGSKIGVDVKLVTQHNVS